MPEPLREFAAAQLTGEQLQAGRDRHLEWAAGLVRTASTRFFGPAQATWYRTLGRERGNLREALHHALGDPRRAAQALQMLTALEPYWVATWQLGEARHWLARATAVAAADAGTRAHALAMAAVAACVQGERETGRSLLEEAETLLASAGVDGAVRGRVLLAHGVEALVSRRPGDALAPLEEAMATARTAGDRSLESWALLVLALCRGLADDVEGAGSALRSCMALTGAAGELQVRSYALAASASLSLLRGDPEAAADQARTALVMATDLGDRLGAALALEVLAGTAASRRHQEHAATLLGAADARWDTLAIDPDTVPYLSVCRRRIEGMARLDAAVRRGAALSDEQVVALALERTPAEEAPEEAVSLTRRELEVARLVGAGLTNRAIAEQLGISQRTVETHVDHVLRKLGFGSRTQVAAWVAEREARRG
jgi:non-specific serine/threonine protein kinase